MNKVKLEMFLTFMILLGSLNYFFIAFRQNIFNVFGRWKIIVYVIIAFGALYKMKLQTFLPFLDRCAFPMDILSQTYPVDSNAELILTDLPPNKIVVYWAAEKSAAQTGVEPKTEAPEGPREAYSDYSNSGIVKSNSKGEAKLHLRCPKQYQVGMFKLPKHIHYRVEMSSAIFSEVLSHQIECD
jgi:hypothetical protein